MPVPEGAAAPGPVNNAEHDEELQAILAMLAALTPIKPEARAGAVKYVIGRLAIQLPGTLPAQPLNPAVQPITDLPSTPEAPNVGDIRSLRELKKPRSAIEMAVLVGYYLSQVAPPGTRKPDMNVDDLRRLFIQGNYPLPKVPKQTLIDAKNAGYLDKAAARGAYQLNPVGHNLVAHTLPSEGTGSVGSGGRTQRPKRKAKTKGKRKAAKRAKGRS